MKVNVLLKTTKDVAALTSAAQNMPVAVQAVSGRYVVDAKSIMGLLSLNLSHPIELSWEECNADKQSVFFKNINAFVADAEEYFANVNKKTTAKVTNV